MGVIQDVEKLIEPMLAEKQYELIDTQYRREAGRWVLRLFIDKKGASNTEALSSPSDPLSPKVPGTGGITLDDCEKVSDWVDKLLDSSQVITDSYVLEVSSPGVNRVLKSESHFRRFVGEKVKVSLYAPLPEHPKQRNYSGILTGFSDQGVEIEDVVSGPVRIPMEAIAKANLDLV